jgi:hypothetical protein
MARSSCLNNCTQALPGTGGWHSRGWMCAGHRVNPLRNYATHSSQQDVVFGQSVPPPPEDLTHHSRAIVSLNTCDRYANSFDRANCIATIA